MNRRNRIAAAAAICLIGTLPAAHAAGDAETVLHTFTGHADGAVAFSGVTVDKHGNMFGTTNKGGSSTACGDDGCGTVFEMIRNGGGWTFQSIYAFQLSDGAEPWSAPIADAHGNLFGTAQGGGTGCGVVYELSPASGGQWSEKVLHEFDPQTRESDGCMPYSSLTFGPDGNLYGTTLAGGGGGSAFGSTCLYGCGTVFELSKRHDGTWKEKVLHAFPLADATTNGATLLYGVTFDSKGNLWGTTRFGGSSTENCGGGAAGGCGILFRLSPAGDGTWNETSVYDFLDSTTGTVPASGLVVDGADNLYGTVSTSPGYGAVFQMTPQEDGSVVESFLHVFPFCERQCRDGLFPGGGLVFDAQGSLYGTTVTGGGKGTLCHPVGCGTLFKLTPDGEGGWSETILHRFTGGSDGYEPDPERLAVDSKGDILGTSAYGGDFQTGDCPQPQYGCGVVFKIKP